MIVGQTVRNDLNSIKQDFNSYSSEIESLPSSWKENSYDSISTRVKEVISEITNVLDSEMNAFASACDLYQKYDECKKNLQSIQSRLSQNKTDQSSDLKSEALYREQMNKLATEIKSLLETAKSQTLQTTSSSSVNSISTSSLGTPSYGTFEKNTFEASNGIKIPYYLYVPNYGKEVSGLPVMLYLHGRGGDVSGINSIKNHGLTKHINEQSINPSGIVICPYVQTYNKGEKNLDALKELVDSVVKDYNADTNKLTVSGHSYGGITTYQLINKYPNYFAAAIPINGFDSVTEAFKYTKVWAFNGDRDVGQRTGYAGATERVNEINNVGGKAYLQTCEGYGHGYVQDYTYSKTFLSSDGDEVNPLEWAFRQSLQSN